MDHSFKKLNNNMTDIPAMPNIVMKALKTIQDPDTSIKTLADIISYDQALCVKVLNLINSSYYGFAKQITSITKAISLLGMNMAKNIIVATAMKPMFSSGRNKALWEHSISVAVGCEYLGNHLNIVDVDEAFIIGFMHDIGKIIINCQEEILVRQVYNFVEQGKNSIDVEDMLFGTNHTIIGVELAKKWQLPDLLVSTIRHHHNPLNSSRPKECSLVYIVNTLLNENFEESMIDSRVTEYLNLKLDEPTILRDSILQKAQGLLDELSY